MLPVDDIVLLFLLGALGSFISGYMGVGGGIVYVPILDYFLSKLGMQNEELVKGILANSLFTIIFAGLVSSFQQYRMRNFFPKEIIYAAVPGIISVLFVTYLISMGDWYSKSLFNKVFAFLMLVILVRMFYKKHTVIHSPTAVRYSSYSWIGFVTGFSTALSGLGGGVVMTPAITEILKQPMQKASSISNGVIPLMALSVGIFNLSVIPQIQVSPWQFGYIIFPVVVPMILASFIFAPLGVSMSHKSKQSVIRYIFASFVGIILVKLLYEMY